MNTQKVIFQGWIKFIALGCVVFAFSSCTTNRYYSYYDGIYEEPKHVPNTVFTDEMIRLNGLNDIVIDTTGSFINPNNINPNANYSDYENNSYSYRNNDGNTTGNNVNVYIDANQDPYWNNGWGWNDPYWGYNYGWNNFGWNNGWGWNNFYWGSNFYGYNRWGWNYPYNRFGFINPYNSWYGYGAWAWSRPRYTNSNRYKNQSYQNQHQFLQKKQ